MSPKRVNISNKIRESVLREFNHKCALCGEPNPQIHHIDGDPSNNSEANLIPLCPNHHLQDQHNPTEPMDSKKLVLFRQCKDPAILDSKFHPLFIRLQFLDTVSENSDTHVIEVKARELCDFIEALNMGEFYSKRIAELLKKTSTPYCVQLGNPASEEAHMRYRKQDIENYRKKVVSNRSKVIALVIELIRYQSWENSFLKK